MNECTACRRDSRLQRNCPRCKGTGNEPKLLRVEVWACATINDDDSLCGNYYASSSAGDLAVNMNTKLNSGEPTHSRARCPDCKAERILCEAVLLIPVEDAKVTA